MGTAVNIRFLRVVLWLFALAAADLSLFLGGVAALDDVEIRQVSLSKEPYVIRVRLSDEAPFKTVQIDAKELMIAFQGAVFAEDVERRGDGDPLISGMAFDTPHEGVATLIVSTGSPIGKVSSHWLEDESTLVVRLTEKAPKGDKAEAAKRTAPVRRQKESVDRAKERPKPTAPPAKKTVKPSAVPQLAAPDSGVPAVSPKAASRPKGYTGSVDDLLLEIKEDPCLGARALSDVGGLVSGKRWREAYQLIEALVAKGEQGECGALAYILRAYSFHRMEGAEDTGHRLKTAALLQEALAFSPDSQYGPYVLALLGKVLLGLGNRAEALGYFQIVLERYRDYSGRPELLFELGRILSEGKDLKRAIKTLSGVVEEYPDSRFAGDARIALGKALFRNHRYIDALGILEGVIEGEPRKVYENPDLLLLVGNAYYSIGKTGKARDPLTKAYNLFPELPGRDVILTRIGDAYVDGGEVAKAIKIYRLVTETFPGTEGFVISSMRLAQHLESRKEKESLYRMVIGDYPDNPLARLAMMRLAQLQHAAGEFDESIDMLKNLMTTPSRALRKEALYLMRDSFESLFTQLLKANEYPDALARFEGEKTLVDKLENPEIFLLVGRAYLKGHIYDRALEMLQKAYDLYDSRKRPASLVLGMGVALHETGKNGAAMTMLQRYVSAFPKGGGVAGAHGRMGSILMAQNAYGEAAKRFERAYRAAGDPGEKAGLLLEKAAAVRQDGRVDKVPDILVSAINHLAEVPGEHFEMIYGAYRQLGETYSQLSEHGKAVDAFTMAIKFADKKSRHAELYFRLAESYHRGNALSKAREAYENVVKTEEEFWVKLARERLAGMDLDEKLKRT